MIIICLVVFLGLSLWLLKLEFSNTVDVRLSYDKNTILKCSGLEALVIAMFATAWIGITPVLSIRLAFLELICIIGIYKCKNRLPFSHPFALYSLFLIWILIGIYYTPSPIFGIRMLLKYLYPFLFAILTAKVVRDGNVFIAAGTWARKVGTIGICFIILPVVGAIIGNILWFNAAYVTGLINIIIFSFALADFTEGKEKRKNLIWGLLLCLPCVIVVYRTDIFGTAVALSIFFFVKYRLKALPIICAIGLLGLCVMFYVPAVKNKMFLNPDKVQITDYLSGNIDEDNVQMNYRQFMWEDATSKFYEGHELAGSGTGRVQTFFYTEAIDNRRGGQLHNDFLVLKCDNGQIGFWLFLTAYFSIMVHCMIIYRRSSNAYVQMCSLVAGASLIGVFVTMFSDNTLSYSMVTLSLPWGFYGMALGMQKENG